MDHWHGRQLVWAGFAVNNPNFWLNFTGRVTAPVSLNQTGTEFAGHSRTVKCVQAAFRKVEAWRSSGARSAGVEEDMVVF